MGQRELLVVSNELDFFIRVLKTFEMFKKEDKSVLSTAETSLGKPSLKIRLIQPLTLIEVLKYTGRVFDGADSISGTP